MRCSIGGWPAKSASHVAGVHHPCVSAIGEAGLPCAPGGAGRSCLGCPQSPPARRRLQVLHRHGGSYTPLCLSAVEFNAIVTTPIETGG